MLLLTLASFCVCVCVVFLAYEGRYCQTDVDGCRDAACFEGVTCTDNKAPEVGATCGPCPTGYAGDGSKCLGKDQH